MSSKRPYRIIMGTNVTDLEDILRSTRQANEHNPWTPETEEEYWNRVRAKAQAGAKEILSTAMTKAQADAEQIRTQAHEEGLDAGLREAQAHLDHALNEISDKMAAVMAAIQTVGPKVTAQYKRDLVIMTRLCVEKILKIEVSTRREESMTRLLDQALEQLEAKRDYVIKVCPDDEEMMNDIMQRAQARHPNLLSWRVRAVPGLHPGGVVVESEEGMADNSMETRRAAVMAILDQLSLDEES